MKRPIALLVGALVASGMTVAAAPPSVADPTVGDDWTMGVTVPRTSWSRELYPNFTTAPCHELAFTVDVSGQAITAATTWSLSVDLRPHGAAAATEAFDVHGTGPGSFPVGDIHICDDFKATDAHPYGLYDVTGEARVPTSVTPTRPLTTTFIVDPLWTSVAMMRHDNTSGSSVITGIVSETQHNADSGTFHRPVTGGSVVLQQLVGGVWTRIADGVWIGSGTFSASAGSILPIGTYVRFEYSGDFSVAGALGLPYQLMAPIAPFPVPPPTTAPTPTPAPVVQQKPTVKIKAVSRRSKLKVDVNPNMGAKYWTFQVQRRNTDGSWKALKTYRTYGATEKRTINLRKGTYRVWVNPKFGYQGAMSANEVTLKR